MSMSHVPLILVRWGLLVSILAALVSFLYHRAWKSCPVWMMCMAVALLWNSQYPKMLQVDWIQNQWIPFTLALLALESLAVLEAINIGTEGLWSKEKVYLIVGIVTSSVVLTFVTFPDGFHPAKKEWVIAAKQAIDNGMAAVLLYLISYRLFKPAAWSKQMSHVIILAVFIVNETVIGLIAVANWSEWYLWNTVYTLINVICLTAWAIFVAPALAPERQSSASGGGSPAHVPQAHPVPRRVAAAGRPVHHGTFETLRSSSN